MADHKEVMKSIKTLPYSDISYPVLVPNVKGLQGALESGATEVAIFGAASESFSQKNIRFSKHERQFKDKEHEN